ncbi:MAG: Uma2 family endonuclease [Saprospiraceae bacterium]|nr:Uma2 family endonuclease [Saprospiraceae bacterium]
MKKMVEYSEKKDKTKNQLEEPSTNYTYDDYLNFEFDHLVELIHGKIFPMTPAPGTTHQKTSLKLTLLIAPYFEKSACHFFSAPTDVILPIGKSQQRDTVVQPDHFVVCDPLKIQESGCFGAPDWVIEILSAHNKKKDLRDKYDAYELAEIGEYWIVFPQEKIVEIFILQEGKYRRGGAFTEDDIISPTRFPDLRCDLSYIFDLSKDV